MRVRWVVNYIDGDGRDDWQLMRNNHRVYFETESEAHEFMVLHKIKGKPSYWQPSIQREEEHVFSYPTWIASKGEAGK